MQPRYLKQTRPLIMSRKMVARLMTRPSSRTQRRPISTSHHHCFEMYWRCLPFCRPLPPSPSPLVRCSCGAPCLRERQPYISKQAFAAAAAALSKNPPRLPKLGTVLSEQDQANDSDGDEGVGEKRPRPRERVWRVDVDKDQKFILCTMSRSA